jgi:DNA-binding response OmpR family regulator
MTLRVLIVEDDSFVALDLELLILQCYPADVVVCPSVRDARRALDNPVDFALLDIDVLDGKTFEVAHALQERATPFVFISGSQPDEVPEGLRNVPFIAKPYSPPVVEQVVGQTLKAGRSA